MNDTFIDNGPARHVAIAVPGAVLEGDLELPPDGAA